MNSTRLNSLLADILISPDDDAPRKVLAEAESLLPNWHRRLIILQCDIAKAVAADPFRKQMDALDHEEKHILSQLNVLQRGFLQLHPEVAIAFHRGMPEVAIVDLPTLIDHGDEWLTSGLFPFLTRLHLTGDTSRIDECCRLRIFERIDHLWFGEALCNDEQVAVVSSATSLRHLKSLSFRFWGDCDDKNALAEYGGVMSSEGAAAIASSPNLNELRTLDLTFHDLGAIGTQHLANSSTLQSLETLVLDLNDIGDDGISALASTNGLPSLTSLSVRNNGISLDGLQSLITGGRAKALRCVHFADNDLGPESGRVIAKACHLTDLERLYIANCSFGSDGFLSLLEFPALSRLRSLNVDRNSVGHAFFDLFRVQHSIEHISAVNNAISDDAVGHLHGITGHHSSVRALILNDNKLGDEFARVISKSPMFSNLETLHLAGNNVRDEGASFIRRSKILKNLRLVSFDGSRVSAEEQRRLIERFGDGVSFR